MVNLRSKKKKHYSAIVYHHWMKISCKRVKNKKSQQIYTEKYFKKKIKFSYKLTFEK